MGDELERMLDEKVLNGIKSGLYNSVAMNVAIPTFVREFNADLGLVQWIMISYTLMKSIQLFFLLL